MEEPTGPTSESISPAAPTEQGTGPTEESTGPTYIITLDELKATQQALVHQEIADRNVISKCIEPDSEELKRRLLQWASVGLSDGFQLSSVSVSPPPKCSDGVVRSKFEYIEFLLGTTLTTKLLALQEKLPGMLLSYSLPDSQLCVHVSKG